MRTEVQNSAEEQLEALYRERYEGLVRLGFLLTSRRADAEDLAQVAFASLAEQWDRVEYPLGFLRRVVVNRAADLHRKTHRRVPARPVPVVGEPEIDETWGAVQTLSSVQRTVVTLRFYEDLSLVEIARVLDRPESTVRSDLRRALRKLRKELSDV